LLPSNASIDVVSVFVPVAIVVVVVGGKGAIVVIVGTIIVPVVSVDVEPFVGTLPGRASTTVSPEPQADTLLRRKRISGPNVTPAGPESNSPDDDDDDDDDGLSPPPPPPPLPPLPFLLRPKPPLIPNSGNDDTTAAAARGEGDRECIALVYRAPWDG
jgi:hypothetical protein